MIDKHQPCGVPGCLNCAPPPFGYMGQAQILNQQATELTDDEKRLRDFLLDQARGAQNITPGSPLYDRLMGTQGYVARHAVDQQAVNQRYADLLAAADAPVRHLCRGILCQLAYFMLLMLAAGAGLWWFL